jgi:hypothetical protein
MAAGKAVRMEFLRSVLYSDHAVASQTTGQFRASTDGNRLSVHVQMSSQVDTDRIAEVQRRFSALTNTHVATDVHMVPYFAFQHGMGVDYERKFTHLVR